MRRQGQAGLIVAEWWMPFPEIMIFGEPTNNEIQVGNKGLLECELNFKGIKVHWSDPEKGKSANMNAIKFLMELDEFYQKEIKVFAFDNGVILGKKQKKQKQQ